MSKKELERKHREEQEATAHAFQEFIKAFQDTPGPPNKTFVKSGILNAKNGQEIESQRGQLYNPRPFIKANTNATIKNAIECARLLKEIKPERVKGQEKPKTNLEILKEELKMRHQEREERIKVKDDMALYSSMNVTNSSNDPNTTNLFIAHVSVKVTESDLMQLFGGYGPLASVKIMWPRTDEKNRTTNCGFVAFMSRKDAERAIQNLKNIDNMKISWGKPVEIPSHPIYIPPELLKLSLPSTQTGLPFNAQPLHQPFKLPKTEVEMQELLYNSVVKVTIPLDKKVLMAIHRTIEFVIREGPLFEAMIMNREINNSTYQFLFDNKKPEHVYYRWKLFSLMEGESYKKWSTKEFRMFKNGSIWNPPVVQDYTKGMPEHLINHNTKVDKSMLSDAQKTRFIQLLQNLNLSKKKISETMVFCLNHVNAVRDVVDMIIDSFMIETTKAPKKIARLYLLSDILYNSSMKKCGAPSYCTEFEKHLLEIFKQLHLTLKNLHLLSDKDAFKRRVLNVLSSWDLWKIYPCQYLINLENIFLNVSVENEVEDDSEGDEPLDGANLIKRSLKNGAKCIVKDKFWDTTQDLKLAGFIQSKWELVDPDQVEAQAMSTKKFYDMELERQICEEKEIDIVASQSKDLSKEDRDILRKVEIMVMHYQDEFESGKRKLKKGTSMERELDDLRNHLVQQTKKIKSDQNKKITVLSDLDDKQNQRKNSKYKKKYERNKKRLHK